MPSDTGGAIARASPLTESPPLPAAACAPAQDIAFFLLVRGKWAWIGWGTWGMTWPFNPEPAHGQLPPMPGGLPLPGSLSVDHGEPAALCHESAPGVFTRTWTKTTVELDCNTFAATFTPAH